MNPHSDLPGSLYFDLPGVVEYVWNIPEEALALVLYTYIAVCSSHQIVYVPSMETHVDSIPLFGMVRSSTNNLGARWVHGHTAAGLQH